MDKYEEDYGEPATFADNCWFFGTCAAITAAWAVLFIAWFHPF